MGKRFRKGQHDSEMIYTLQLDSLGTAIFCIHPLLQQLRMKRKNNTITGSMQKQKGRSIATGMTHRPG